MSTARFTLTFPDLSHESAFARMDEIEDHLAIDALAVTINETDEAQGFWETVAWFETVAEAEAALAIFGPARSIIAEVPDKDWVKLSLEGLAPVVAGRFFLYGSHDRNLRRSGGTSLEIDAGTAFGTGHHGTTAGCLEAFDYILKKSSPRRILDLGCGTGVLGLAAAKATKRKILATDIDAEAVRVTLLNAARNDARSFVQGETAAGLHHASIAAAAPYDLIFANILARPLAQLAHGLSRILAPGGNLILSGLTVDQKRWISACYRARGLIPVETLVKGNWVTLVFTRPDNKKRPNRNGFGRQVTWAHGPGWGEA
ncbi:MAG: 50S ribosomal protein L11 methyltransferase [Aestuariivirga sp.]